MSTATQATPSITINSSGLITAAATQTAGYVSAGTTSSTKQLTTQAAKTITPSKSSQTAVAKDVYTTGTVTVAAIPSQYITTTDATAAASEIFSGETAYVNGSKVTGTFTIDSEITTQNDLIAQIQSIVDSLPDADIGGSGEPEMINFAIEFGDSSDPTICQCQAEQGMSIGSWMCSKYNNLPLIYGTDYMVINKYINFIYAVSAYDLHNNGNRVSLFDTIISNEIYTATYSTICCFVAGTQVLVSLDGETKSIEEIKIGDDIVSYNIETDENYIAKVKRTIIKEQTTDIAEITFANGTILTMNAYHPLYTDNGWHSITNYNNYETLIVGDKTKTIDGWTKIININRYISEPVITYNLDVIDIDEEFDSEINDNFYANGIVVHNPPPSTCT